MAKTLLEVYQDNCDLTVKDRNLPRRILEFEQYILNKTPEHTEYFGGVNLSNPKVSWSTKDGHRFLEEVAMVSDPEGLVEDISELGYIKEDWKTLNEPIYLIIPYIMHILYLQDKSMRSMAALESIVTIALVRNLTGLMRNRLKYGTSPEVTAAFFETLSKKHILRAKGSWIGFMRHKTGLFIRENGPYPELWQKFENELAVIQMVSEMNNTVRKPYNLLTQEFIAFNKRNIKLSSVSSVGTIDGERVLKDKIRKSQKLIADVLDFCDQPTSLIKEEVLDVTYKLVSNASEDMGKQSLEFLSDNLYSKDGYRDMIENYTVYILGLYRNRRIDFSNTTELVRYIRSQFKTSSTQNKQVLDIKERMFHLSERANPGLRKPKHASNVGALVAYLAIRLVAIDYYKR